MWCTNNDKHRISEERKFEIDKARIEKGLNTLFKSKNGEKIELDVE